MRLSCILSWKKRDLVKLQWGKYDCDAHCVSTWLRNCMRTAVKICAVQNFLRGNTAPKWCNNYVEAKVSLLQKETPSAWSALLCVPGGENIRCLLEEVHISSLGTVFSLCWRCLDIARLPSTATWWVITSAEKHNCCNKRIHLHDLRALLLCVHSGRSTRVASGYKLLARGGTVRRQIR